MAQAVNVIQTTEAAARLAGEVMALFTPTDERETGFEHIHLHGFIDAYEQAREAGLDPHRFVEGMLRESPQEKLLSDARRIIEVAAEKKKERDSVPTPRAGAGQ